MFKSVFKGILIFIFILSTGVAIISQTLSYQKKRCAAKSELMKMEHQWGIYAGCFIEIKSDVWIPLDNYRVMKESN